MAARIALVLVLLSPLVAHAITFRNSQSAMVSPGKTDLAFISSKFRSVVDAALDARFAAVNTSNVNATQHKKAALMVVHKEPDRESLSGLAAQGAKEVNADEALTSLELPANVQSLVRKSGHNKVEPAMVEKAVANLNNMVAQAQVRLDAKNDECEEFKAKSDQTLEQINGDLARLGQEAADTARSITATLGSMDATGVNNEQLKEERQREFLAYDKVRSMDQAQLDKQQADLDVSTFILEFTKCKDAPASSSALLQHRHKDESESQLTSTSFKMCSNGTAGAEDELVFADPRLDSKTKELSPDARGTLRKFADPRVQAFILGASEQMDLDRDDGDVDEKADKILSILSTKQQPAVAPPVCETTITATITSTSKDLCQDPSGGKIEYTGVQCEKGLVKWTSARAIDLAEGKKEEECAWDFEKLEKEQSDMLAGSCGVAPTVAGGDTLPLTCQLPTTEAVAKPAKAELKSANKCSQAEPHCAILHDLFASLWGEMKDLVDASKMKMAQDEKEWKELDANINAQLQSNAVQTGNLETTLAESTSFKSAVTEEQLLKQKEKTETQKIYDAEMGDCKAIMREILFTEICGVSAVRNNIIAEHLPDEPSAVDCSVSEWVPGDCSSPCDAEMRGGIHQLTREVITKNSPRGARCPALTTSRKCNQIKCPVDCKLTKFSGWSKCTKECGGGVQSQTRARAVEPKNGGEACDALMESQPCNTQSCDVDCDLGDWAPWATCSKSCNSGYEERNVRVVAEALGEGHCLPFDDKERRERRDCNTQACVGDERCNPLMDLVIAIDASGSVTEKGFDILKEFAAKLVDRMDRNVRVAIVQFGNGKLDKDKIVSDAKEITKGFEDKKAVLEKINGLVWQQGFTNMAQAIFKAKDVLVASRPTAQNAVLLITDGRPSFKFQTDLAVKKLRESARLMFVHVQRFRKQEMAELLKYYASDPWSNNYVHIPGKHKLKLAYHAYATEVLGDLCSDFQRPRPRVGPCTTVDGSAASDAYPCICGDVLCIADGEKCNKGDSYCMPGSFLQKNQTFFF